MRPPSLQDCVGADGDALDEALHFREVTAEVGIRVRSTLWDSLPNRQDCRFAQPEVAPKGCGTLRPPVRHGPAAPHLQAPRPTPVLPCSLRSRLQIASDRPQNVRARTDNEPDNDHTNTPRTTQIGRLFLLSSPCLRRPHPQGARARHHRFHGEPTCPQLQPVLRGARRRGASIPAFGDADRAGAVADHRARLLPVYAHCAGCDGRGEAYQDESTAEGLSVRSIHPSSSRIPDSFSSDRTPPSNGSRSRWDDPLRDPHRNRADGRTRLRVSADLQSVVSISRDSISQRPTGRSRRRCG